MEPYRKKIDGHAYEVAPFLGMQGWQLQLRLAKIIGPTIKAGMAAMPSGKIGELMEGHIDMTQLGGAIGAFIEALAAADPQGSLVAELLSSTQRDGRVLTEGEINKAFAANYGELVKALLAVVEANDFFGIASFGFIEGAERLATAAPAAPAL